MLSCPLKSIFTQALEQPPVPPSPASCAPHHWLRHHQLLIKAYPDSPKGRKACSGHDAHGSKVWAEWVEGELPASGQLVTKPTLLLKLGHRIEMGTAELSPNRTVAHLVLGF